jgi:type II secretory pathway pseudopilin PulG
MHQILKGWERGVVLLELLIVLMILGLLITGAVRTWDTVITQRRFTQTIAEMDEIINAIVGNPELISDGRRIDFGYVGDMGALPESLGNLVQAPEDAECWRGPYIKVKFTENPNDYLEDGWGSPYIYLKDSLILRSYGGGSNLTPAKWITKRIAPSREVLLRNRIIGYVKDITNSPPGYKHQFLRIYITYPFNGHWYTPPPVIPEESGYYSIVDIPQGIHKMVCIYDTTLLIPNDTADYIEKYVTVYPGATNTVDIKLTIQF